MVKIYIPLPNFSTAPPPDGPLHLGSVLRSLDPSHITAPLNRKKRDAIDEDDLQPLDIKRGYRTTRKALRSGDFGLWAQLASVFGIGVEGNVSYERETDDVLNVETLETSTFILTPAYVDKVLAAPPVQTYLSITKQSKPVYLVTGLKVARGVSMESSRSVNTGARLKLGYAHPGVPVEGGPDLGVTRTRAEGVSFQESSDFVIAVRVEKIVIDKKGTGQAKTTLHVKGATMEDEDKGYKEKTTEFVVEDVEKDELSGLATVFQSTGFVSRNAGDEDAEEAWMVPASLEN